jgi:hypothetical protein
MAGWQCIAELQTLLTMRVQFAAAATLGLFAQVVSGGAAALAA